MLNTSATTLKILRNQRDICATHTDSCCFTLNL